MDKLIEKTKIYFNFNDENIKYFIEKYNSSNNIKSYYWSILMNKIYNYIYYYYIDDTLSGHYIYSSLFNKVNGTLNKKIFYNKILDQNNYITINLIKEKLKDYIEEIIFSRVFINEIISNFINEKKNNQELNGYNIKSYIEKIEKEYFNREEPTYTKYNSILNRFTNLI
jgi:hypothetical protein